MDSITSSQKKEELLWYDTERWVNKLYKSTREALPVQPGGPSEDSASGQLKKIRDFVVMGTQILNRLKNISIV